MDFGLVVFFRQNEIGLDPGNALARIDQQFANPLGIESAILVQLFSACFSDGFDTAFHGDAMSAAEQIEGLLVPEINAALESNLYRTLRDTFQQTQNVLSHAEYLVNEVDVIHSARNHAINFGQHRFHCAFAKLIAEQGLVAEGAGPWASTREFQLGPVSLAMEDVVTMTMTLHGIIVKVKRADGFHVGYAKIGADMLTVIITPAASGNVLPGFCCQLRQRLVGLTAHDHFAACLAQSGAWSCRRMRTDCYRCSLRLQCVEPLARHTQFGRRATQEQIRRSCRNDQKIRIEVADFGSDIRGAEVFDLSIYEQRLST